jgi:Xaa-Pro dipeptidase
LFILHGKNSDSKAMHAGATFEGIDAFKVNKSVMMHELTECRVIKTKAEIELMRYVNRISSEAHLHVMKTTKPDMMEFQLEANFQHFAYYHGGARHMSYTCICAAGKNGATLHYGHAGAPNISAVRPNHLLLLDMGAEYHCYGSDITRSFPSDGKYNPQQRAIYNAVLAAQKAVMDDCKPGVSWPDMHRLAERVILQHLLEIGLVRGSLEELEAHFIANVFMPHGLGHLLGIDTHDVGGYPNGMTRKQEPGLASLRCGRTLEAGMVITVEPGIYFNWPELVLHLEDPSKSKFLVAEEIAKFKDFGGVRIEDDILITETGMENLTTVPATIEEIEAILATNPFIIAHHATK